MRGVALTALMIVSVVIGIPTDWLAGHEGGNPGYRQGMFYLVTAPALDPTNINTEVLFPDTADLKFQQVVPAHVEEAAVRV